MTFSILDLQAKSHENDGQLRLAMVIYSNQRTVQKTSLLSVPFFGGHSVGMVKLVGVNPFQWEKGSQLVRLKRCNT